MEIVDAFKRFFRSPAPERPADIVFPNIAVPLVTIDGKTITYGSNATVVDAKKGLLITAKHCIMRNQRLAIRLDNKWQEAFPIKAHRQRDIALLRTETSLEQFGPIVPWTTKFPVNEMVFIRGWLWARKDSLEDYKPKCFWGKICGKPEEGELPIRSELAKKDCVRGLSGSPAINSRKELIGIYVARDQICFYRLRKIYVTPVSFAQELF